MTDPIIQATPAAKRPQSCGMFSKIAALPPMTLQTRGIAAKIRGFGYRLINRIPRVKIVVGHGVTPNRGVSGYGWVTSNPISGYTAYE